MLTLDLTPDEDRARRVLIATMRYRGVSGAALGRAVGTTRATINDKIKGRCRLGLDDVVRFSKALGVEPTVFFLEPDDAVRWAMDHAPAFVGENGFAELSFVLGVLGSVVATWAGMRSPELAVIYQRLESTDDPDYVNSHPSWSADPALPACSVMNPTLGAISVHRPRTYCGARADQSMHTPRGFSAPIGLGSR